MIVLGKNQRLIATIIVIVIVCLIHGAEGIFKVCDGGAHGSVHVVDVAEDVLD